jgi:KUP system potassium uptake protein
MDASPRSNRASLLVVAALGVAFGDIGTSPLYALKEAFNPHYGFALTRANVLGILSLIAWSMAWVIGLKYLTVLMRADNRGEGGTLALLALALRETRTPRARWAVIVLGVFGASMFFGDSMITPAISVLSAVEGLAVAEPALEPYVIPVTLGLLAALFLIQRRGTASVGALFGPVTSVWFFAMAFFGLLRILDNPSVLAAVDPRHGFAFLAAHPGPGFLVLGAVFLALTGGEALYADMGHFGARPIRMGWFTIVMPALLTNYFGQGALVLADPAAILNPFFLLVPEELRMPMVALAACAAVIASQAVISGAFSVTRQAIQLGYIPRLEILQTSERAIGQVYIPFVNWTLFVAVVLLVLEFRSASNLANAYGIAVAATMATECLLAMVVARHLWKWGPAKVALVMGAFLLVDLTFLASNLTKFPAGGWFPLVIGAAIFAMLSTWKRGRALMAKRLSEEGLPLKPFLASLAADPPQRVAGTAIFMTSNPESVPHALLHNLKHNKVLHERVVFLTIITHDVPAMPRRDRIHVEWLMEGFYLIEAWYGFAEQPDVIEILDECGRSHAMRFDLMETSFFLSRENVIATAPAPRALFWRDPLFAWMSRNATRATDFFNIPANRVVELGTHLEI